MKRRFIAGSMVAGMLVVSLFAAPDADAGQVFTPPDGCSAGNAAEGILPSCSGTMDGFRTSTNAGDFASFFQYEGGAISFVASYAGSYYSCYAPSDSPISPSVPLALSATGEFFVQWNSSGECLVFESGSASYYGNTW